MDSEIPVSMIGERSAWAVLPAGLPYNQPPDQSARTRIGVADRFLIWLRGIRSRRNRVVSALSQDLTIRSVQEDTVSEVPNAGIGDIRGWTPLTSMTGMSWFAARDAPASSQEIFRSLDLKIRSDSTGRDGAAVRAELERSAFTACPWTTYPTIDRICPEILSDLALGNLLCRCELCSVVLDTLVVANLTPRETISTFLDNFVRNLTGASLEVHPAGHNNPELGVVVIPITAAFLSRRLVRIHGALHKRWILDVSSKGFRLSPKISKIGEVLFELAQFQILISKPHGTDSTPVFDIRFSHGACGIRIMVDSSGKPRSWRTSEGLSIYEPFINQTYVTASMKNSGEVMYEDPKNLEREDGGKGRKKNGGRGEDVPSSDKE